MAEQHVPEHMELQSIKWPAWQASISEGSGEVILPKSSSAAKRFRASARGTRYSSAFVATISAQDHKFIRSCHRIAQDGIDMVFVQAYDWTKGCKTLSGRQTITLQPDTLIIQDMAELSLLSMLRINR